MSNIQTTEDQYLNDLIYIGETAKAFGLTEVLSLTMKQYNLRQEELNKQKLPWVN